MPVATDAPLAPLTTLRLGGPAKRLMPVESEAELVDAVREVDASGEPLLVLAGGSNLVLPDAGWPGVVVHVQTGGVAGEDGVLEVQAGESWDDLVAATVADGLAGFECLSGIPGSVGATPIQNVGAYGQEVAASVRSVRVVDRSTWAVSELAAAECGFGYRTSAFKGSDRWVVLAVTFALRRSAASQPLRYAELARALEVEPGATAALDEVRAGVLALRRGKGMVIDPADPDTVSAGSFFMNPILDADAYARLDPAPPAFPQPDGRIKTSAAWLIERSGFRKGYARGRVAISSKHALALVNRGGATTQELLALAREIAGGVRERFGVELEPEPTIVGGAW
ncbi:MAG: UDP-N-acetylmuramate dehydrogenase [Solirubrobacteraceae bacterium]